METAKKLAWIMHDGVGYDIQTLKNKEHATGSNLSSFSKEVKEIEWKNKSTEKEDTTPKI